MAVLPDPSDIENSKHNFLRAILLLQLPEPGLPQVPVDVRHDHSAPGPQGHLGVLQTNAIGGPCYQVAEAFHFTTIKDSSHPMMNVVTV